MAAKEISALKLTGTQLTTIIVAVASLLGTALNSCQQRQAATRQHRVNSYYYGTNYNHDVESQPKGN